MLERIIRRLKKGGIFLFRNDYFDFFEKLKVITSLNRNATIRDLFQKRLVVSNDGLDFFSIGGYKIYFRPDYEIADREYFLKGIINLLSETFIYPDYFSSKVYAKKGDIVLDVGANIGTTALVFSKIVGENGKVFAFDPITHNTISTNVEKNNIKNVEVVGKGLLNKTGKIEIEMSDYCLDSSMVKREYKKNYYTQKRMIDVTTLDSFAEDMDLDRIDFINLDVEGAEELVIKGAEKVINKYSPKWSVASYHIDFNNEPQHDNLVKLLEKSGYKIKELKGPPIDPHIYAWK